VGVHEVRWKEGGTVRAGAYIFFYGKGKENHQLGKGFFVHHKVVSADNRVEFDSDRISLVLRGRWCNILVLNVQAPTGEKSDDSKECGTSKTGYEELEHIFGHFPKYHKFC
jgi:hypothetical protein